MYTLNIKIVGLGEGGAHAIDKMISADVGKGKGVEFMAVGNDENIMLASAARKNIFLNRDITTVYKGIADALRGAKLIFLVGGLGGNAARTAIPIITSCAKNLGAVTVALVCRPFVLENVTRKINADYTLKNLRGKVDTLIEVPAEKFFAFRLNQSEVSLAEVFDAADEVFCRGVEIFLSVLTDDDSSLIFFKWGNAAFGYGTGKTALEAVKAAAKFPTLEDDDISRTTGIFLRLASKKNLSLSSVEAANKFIKAQLQPDAKIFSREDVDGSFGEKVFASIIFNRKEL